MDGDYGYANARIRAMKSRLLNGRAYDELLAATRLDDMLEVLAGTAYKAEIEAALVKYGGMQCVTEALRRNVAHTIGKIKTFFDGRPRERVARLLTRWDLFNLITMLRGQARGIAADDILDTLVPAGELTEVELRELAQQPNMRATADVMLAWHLPYAKPLARALATFGAADVLHLETRLYQWHYHEALAGLSNDANDTLLREMLHAEIDVANLATLLRLCRLRDHATQLQARYGVPDATPLLISDGGLPRWMLEELSTATNVAALVRGLSGTPYAACLADRLETYRQSGDLTALLRGLEEFLVRKGVGMLHRDPLSIAIPIGYFSAKMNEVANVRLIAQGKVLGLDRDVIESDLRRI